MAEQPPPAQKPSRTAIEHIFRPDPAARIVLGTVGALAGLAVALVPAIVLSQLGYGSLAAIVMLVGVGIGLWRTAQVGVSADATGITVRHVWSTETLRWKRVDRIVEDRRAWLPGVTIPTLRLRGDADIVPLLGAAGVPGGSAMAELRSLHGRRAVVDWRSEPFTVPLIDLDGASPEAPATG